MDEEVKRRRKEREQQAMDQEHMRKMEQNKHLLANLYNQKPMLTQSLNIPSQLLAQKLNQQRTQTGSISQLQRPQAQTQSALQQPSQNVALLSLQRNPNQPQQRTHNSWPNNSTTTSATNQGPQPNMVTLNSNLFYPQPFLSLPQLKNQSLPLHQSPSLSAKNPLEEILDLTMSSPSPSPDTTEGRLNLDSVTGHPAGFGDEFNLESLISQSNAPHAAQIQLPLMLQQQQQQQQHLQATQQQNHNLLANNHQDLLLELFDLPLSPQMPTQKASPSSSTSSGSSSTSSTSSVSNNLVSHVSAGLPPASTVIPTSSSSSLFSSPSSSSSIFSNPSPCFPSPYLLPQSDSLSLPNGHCSTALDVREALNSMLAGPDRKSVIQYRQQD